MADSRTRIALCGLGSIGRAAATILLDHRSGLSIVGAVTKQHDAIGRPLHEVAGAATAVDVSVGSKLDDILSLRPDLVIYCTGSFLSDVREDVHRIVDAGASLVSPCEELAFPFTRAPDYAAALDQRARRSGATVLGTGVNPGFIFDALLLASTGSAWDVRSIRGRRVVDVSGFAQTFISGWESDTRPSSSSKVTRTAASPPRGFP